MFTLKHRVFLTQNCLDKILKETISTETGFKISPKESVVRHHFRGVPASSLDICISSRLSPDYGIVAEIGLKTGKYDNKTRWRLTLRRWDKKERSHTLGGETSPIVDGYVELERFEGTLTIEILDYNLGSVIWSTSKSYCENTEYDVPGLLDFLLERFFDFLDPQEYLIASELMSIEQQFPTNPHWTEVEANRYLSHKLEELSVKLGWVKLTAKEKRELRTSACWIKGSVFK